MKIEEFLKGLFTDLNDAGFVPARVYSDEGPASTRSVGAMLQDVMGLEKARAVFRKGREMYVYSVVLVVDHHAPLCDVLVDWSIGDEQFNKICQTWRARVEENMP